MIPRGVGEPRGIAGDVAIRRRRHARRDMTRRRSGYLDCAAVQVIPPSVDRDRARAAVVDLLVARAGPRLVAPRGDRDAFARAAESSLALSD
jgi:hypothetical protein